MAKAVQHDLSWSTTKRKIDGATVYEVAAQGRVCDLDADNDHDREGKWHEVILTYDRSKTQAQVEADVIVAMKAKAGITE